MNLSPACRVLVANFLAALLFMPGLSRSATEDSGPAASADSSSATDARSSAIENSVVKVFSTVRYPDPYKPWTKQAPVEYTSSGVIIEGKRILCNAHAVLYASQIQIQPNQAGDRISATLVTAAPGIDLAVLKLDDESCFETRPPLPRATKLPEIKDAVMVYGYPKGGTSLSITKGIVSRIEFATYNFPVSGLRVQIDAAINPGNSGGPAVVDGKLVGLAFAHLGNAENIGYIIPCEEIELFLKDVADGRCDTKPAMFDELQTLENPGLRSFLKLDKSMQGMVVHRPDSTEPDYPLKQWDIVTKIGSTPIDDQGMVKVGSNLRVNFRYLIQKIAREGKVHLTVVRAGKEIEVDLPVTSRRDLVIPEAAGSYPPFFVYGPLVFSSATSQFLSGLSRGSSGGTMLTILSAAGSPLVRRIGEKPAFPGERLVVVSSPFFPHKLSRGYGNPISQVVKSVNGIPIKNLDHLVEVLRDSKERFITLEFDSRYSETMVFPRSEMVAATEDILTDNGLRSQGSADTLAIWNATASK